MEEDSVHVLKFAESRAQEIMTLMSEVTQEGGKFCLQRLPFHMRRRAASHNPKRIPRNMRKRVQEESKAKHKKKKKAPKNLLEEYNSRQKIDLWLPTHIWFAKRFHMKRMWGYQLPVQATGKRFRSSYRATVKNVLVQDLSYFCCIELNGEEEKILSKLSCLTDESVGMTFASESCIDGTREGHCFVYHLDTFPLHAIGPVSFLWKPYADKVQTENNCSSSLHRQLWIWCHPSITDELVKVLIEIFLLKENLERLTKTYKFASNVNYMKCKLHFQKEPVYSSNDITMCILKDTLIRHRIIGPNALSLLTSILKPTELNEEVPEKRSVWSVLSDPESNYFVPIKIVIGATVEDPRLHVTSENVNNVQPNTALDEFHKDRILEEFSKPITALSKIWDYECRNEVTASQVSEAILNKERGKYIVPLASELMKHTTSVPVLLIHQPACNGYAAGWDLIAPQGWGMAFWIPFIYHGAQPAGFDDLCCINFECGCSTFPLSFPDTEAGSVFEEKVREEKLKKYYRYSRAKRPNFKILGVPSPFFMPWKLLVSEWEKEFLNKYQTTVDERTIQDENDCFVLRTKKDLVYMQNMNQLLQKSNYKEVEKAINSMIQSILTSQNKLLKGLILVRVKCLSRGTPSNCSGIYLPKEFDLLSLRENPKNFGLVETKHDTAELSGMPPKKRQKILKEEAKVESKKLEKPDIKSVISVSERKLIGYISEGGYSRLGSQGYGIGHCAITAFLDLLQQCVKCQMNMIVLIREQHSFQYRLATIEILNKVF